MVELGFNRQVLSRSPCLKRERRKLQKVNIVIYIYVLNRGLGVAEFELDTVNLLLITYLQINISLFRVFKHIQIQENEVQY